MKKVKRCFRNLLIIVYSLLLTNCSDPISSPPDIPIKELLSAPEVLIIENKSIKLETTVYLDLQPVVSSTPMIAAVFIETVDSSYIPSIIDTKSIYIVKDNKVWKSFFSSEAPPETNIKPYRIVKIARDGPKWGPDIYVDVVVSLKIKDKSYLIRASDQYIGAAY